MIFGMQGQVEQWIDFTTQEIDAPMLSWFLPIMGFMEYNKKVPGCTPCASHNLMHMNTRQPK